jgi:hypothetical protein
MDLGQVLQEQILFAVVENFSLHTCIKGAFPNIVVKVSDPTRRMNPRHVLPPFFFRREEAQVLAAVLRNADERCHILKYVFSA